MSSCDATVPDSGSLYTLHQDKETFFVTKGLNILSNPLADHTVTLLPQCYPKPTPIASTHELCDLAA